MTVLIVDDERHITHIVGRKLERSGLRVYSANFGREALDIAIEHVPDIVVTDFQMPGMTGLELAIALHNHPRTAHTPVIMVTARGHRLPSSELVDTNIREIMMKPFSPNELLVRVEEILDARLQRPESSAA
jgi:DNA-binding response OmpR family regulator